MRAPQAAKQMACHDLPVPRLHGYFSIHFIDLVTTRKNLPSPHYVNPLSAVRYRNCEKYLKCLISIRIAGVADCRQPCRRERLIRSGATGCCSVLAGASRLRRAFKGETREPFVSFVRCWHCVLSDIRDITLRNLVHYAGAAALSNSAAALSNCDRVNGLANAARPLLQADRQSGAVRI